jgi:hypothetical protein
MLLLEAGLPVDMLSFEPEVSVETARRLQLAFVLSPPLARTYAPRLVAETLLREVVEGGTKVSREQLGQRLTRYHSLKVLRPDGYLAAALTGRPEQCVGPVEVRDGVLRAREFEVGSFYAPQEGGSWRRVESAASSWPAESSGNRP